jgi:LemA protein
MSNGLKIGLIILGVIVLFGGCGGCGYNSLVQSNQQVSKAWADVETQYQRRADLIPNLVNTIKGSGEFEQSTLMGVIEARSNATSINLTANDLTPENLAKFEAAQNQLSSSLSRLLVTVERYPDLKTTKAYQDLMVALEGAENRISKARTDFNQAVERYNSNVLTFPKNLLAGMFGFREKPYFKGQEGTENVPEVTF